MKYRIANSLFTSFFSLSLLACGGEGDLVQSESNLKQSGPPPTYVRIPRERLGRSFELLLKDLGSAQAFAHDCALDPQASEFVCGGLPAISASLISDTPAALTFRLDLLSIGKDSEETTTSYGLRVVRSWFWGTYCELEDSDRTACNDFCGGDVRDLSVSYDPMLGLCHAVCKCDNGRMTVTDTESTVASAF